ncbi:MAG: gamma carbonic anhydrase family protein [Pseudohongiella sp.]|nr:MAG: gamma carbonic anhydrase family protein [Pseudohongiella sp.]
MPQHIGPHVTLDEPGFVHDTAQLHGKVHVGKGASIWAYVVTRSERFEIKIGARTNIQDFVMIHEGGGNGTYIGEDCSITHHAIVHGCTIGDRCLIGINATIMDGAKIGNNCIVAGNAIVSENSEFPDNSIIGGVPAKLLGTRDNSAANLKNSEFYQANAKLYASGRERMVDE